MKNCEQLFLDIIVLNKDSSPYNTQSRVPYFSGTQDAYSKVLATEICLICPILIQYILCVSYF